MEFCMAGFIFGMPVILEGKPQSDDKVDDDDNRGDAPAEGGPIKLEPCGPG